MKKKALASAIALGLGASGAADALTVSLTQMRFFGTPYNASGTLNSSGGGNFTSLDTFFGHHWTADGVAFFSGAGAHTWQTVGANATNDTIPIGTATYGFSLTSNQVAWGTFFDWNGNFDIPVLNIMTCTGTTTGSACTGTGTPMQTPPFMGQAPAFDGVVASASTPAVPIPAAAWLMGSGLIGLAGVARRNKKNA